MVAETRRVARLRPAPAATVDFCWAMRGPTGPSTRTARAPRVNVAAPSGGTIAEVARHGRRPSRWAFGRTARPRGSPSRPRRPRGAGARAPRRRRPARGRAVERSRCGRMSAMPSAWIASDNPSFRSAPRSGRIIDRGRERRGARRDGCSQRRARRTDPCQGTHPAQTSRASPRRAPSRSQRAGAAHPTLPASATEFRDSPMPPMGTCPQTTSVLARVQSCLAAARRPITGSCVVALPSTPLVSTSRLTSRAASHDASAPLPRRPRAHRLPRATSVVSFACNGRENTRRSTIAPRCAAPTSATGDACAAVGGSPCDSNMIQHFGGCSAFAPSGRSSTVLTGAETAASRPQATPDWCGGHRVATSIPPCLARDRTVVDSSRSSDSHADCET